jgi:hypothetical protein
MSSNHNRAPRPRMETPIHFRELSLRAHAFLDDVPLHDVWRVELGPRESEPDIRQVRAIVTEELFGSPNPVARALFGLRDSLRRAPRCGGLSKPVGFKLRAQLRGTSSLCRGSHPP